MSLTVLGLGFGHDGSATIVRDHKILCHITSERITRIKKQRGVTRKVLDYVLKGSGLKLTDIDIVSVSNWFWDRDSDFQELFNKSKEGFSIYGEEGVELSFNDYVKIMQGGNIANGIYTMDIDGTQLPCFLIDHHFAHACYSFYTSPFNESFTMSLDVNDNLGTNHSVFYFGEDGSFRMIRKDGSFSVGKLYSEMCDYLGFYPSLVDAGKVMALAAYGKSKPNELDQIVWPNNVQMGDIYHGDQYPHLLNKNGISRFPDSRNYYPQLRGEGGQRDPFWLNKRDWESDLSKQLASDTQYILERSVYNFLEKLDSTQTITNNLCVAGGTFLNCVMNGVLMNETKWNVHASPACGDDGLSIGGALFLSYRLNKKDGQIAMNDKKFKKHSPTVQKNISGGVRYKKSYIKECIENKSYTHKPFDKEEIINYILKDKIVALFQGGSEIGPRALGYRSIIANPINPSMKDVLNERVKHREGFRPFAPMILEDDVCEWFDVPVTKSKKSPYMLFSYQCKKPKEIPSAVHIDDSARIQTITESDNKRVFELLTEMKKQSGVPVLINTSFNVMGEPIVESPENALNCFEKTEIDILIMEDFVVFKKGILNG